MPSREIPIQKLDIQTPTDTHCNSTPVLENEIQDLQVEHVALSNETAIVDATRDGYKIIYLFLKGAGNVSIESTNYEIEPELILLPNAAQNTTVKPAHGSTLHYLKISRKLSAQDQLELRELPAENTQSVYYAKFSDCQPYTEAIKSQNTVSRTILSNEYIPRVAMGTVQTKGPDEVAAHEHPMLEQLFLGLSENKCIVYADNDQIEFPEHSLLHIPLGSSHSVSVKQNQIMYYVWMDFFLDKEGENWLKTHKIED